MAYDPGLDKVVLFGGYVPRGGSRGVWTWDGSGWEQLHGTNPPPRRSAHVMEYDPVHEEIVLFGGWNHSGEELGDTWVFRDGQWTERLPSESPPARFRAAMAYDPQLQQVVLFGGLDQNRAVLDDTWAWDGSTWTELHPATSPPARWWADLAFDPTSGGLVLFGGFTAGEPLRDTWRWDGQNWIEEFPLKSPPPVGAYAMATFGRHVVLFSGAKDGPRNAFGTWILKADTWRRLILDPKPPPRSAAAMEWDPGRHEAVMFGGYAGPTAVVWTLGSAPGSGYSG
jgi:hypothetical protein